MAERMIPYCTSRYTLRACNEIAEKLRASGKYTKVVVRRTGTRRAGSGRVEPFGRVYVTDE